MSQEQIDKIIDLVRNVSAELWSAVSQAVLAKAITDGVIALFLIATSIVILKFSIWVWRQYNPDHYNDDHRIAAIAVWLVGMTFMSGAVYQINSVLTSLLAPKYVAIQRLIELIP